MDTKAAAREILADAGPNPMDDWRHTEAILARVIRWEIPLRDVQETLHILRYLAEELPNIVLRIEREETQLDRQIMAQHYLQMLRGRIKRSGK